MGTEGGGQGEDDDDNKNNNNNDTKSGIQVGMRGKSLFSFCLSIHLRSVIFFNLMKVKQPL